MDFAPDMFPRLFCNSLSINMLVLNTCISRPTVSIIVFRKDNKTSYHYERSCMSCDILQLQKLFIDTQDGILCKKACYVNRTV